MDNIFDTLFGLMYNNYATTDKVGRDTIGEYTIDTCDTADQGWETAVWKDPSNIIIVARYPTKIEAEAGHGLWVEICELTKPDSLFSVQTDEYETL